MNEPTTPYAPVTEKHRNLIHAIRDSYDHDKEFNLHYRAQLIADSEAAALREMQAVLDDRNKAIETLQGAIEIANAATEQMRLNGCTAVDRADNEAKLVIAERDEQIEFLRTKLATETARADAMTMAYERQQPLVLDASERAKAERAYADECSLKMIAAAKERYALAAQVAALNNYVAYLAEGDKMSATFLHTHSWCYPASFIARGDELRAAINKSATPASASAEDLSDEEILITGDGAGKDMKRRALAAIMARERIAGAEFVSAELAAAREDTARLNAAEIMLESFMCWKFENQPPTSGNDWTNGIDEGETHGATLRELIDNLRKLHAARKST